MLSTASVSGCSLSTPPSRGPKGWGVGRGGGTATEADPSIRLAGGGLVLKLYEGGRFRLFYGMSRPPPYRFPHRDTGSGLGMALLVSEVGAGDREAAVSPWRCPGSGCPVRSGR